MKLEISHLIKYAPYNLNLLDESGVIMTLEGFDLQHPKGIVAIAERTSWKLSNIRPVLIPLHKYKDYEDILDEFSEYSEEHFQFSFFSDLGRSLNCLDQVNCTIAELMYKYHLDLYGLIDAGLAVDKNLLNKSN